MKKVLIAAIALLFAWSSAAFAYQRVPNSGSLYVFGLLVRTPGYTIDVASDGFYFTVNAMVLFQDSSPVTACLSANPTNVFGIPKLLAAPGPTLSQNPSYAESVNLITLAYTNTFKAVVLYVDGCINGVPRVVGIDVVNPFP